MTITRSAIAALFLALAHLTLAQAGDTALQTFSKEGNTVKSGNGLVMMGPGPAYDDYAAQMRKKLTDPQLRKQLRAETYAQIVSMHPDIAEAIGLDAKEEAALLDLVTDQQMQHLELFYSVSPQEHMKMAQAFAEEETRNNQRIEELIGAERFDGYVAYKQTLRERIVAARFNERLAPADKLSVDQKPRLLEILRTELEQSMRRPQLSSRSLLPDRLAGSRAEIQAQMQKRAVESMSDSFWQMQDDNRRLLARLPEVLTPNQIAEYVKMQDEQLAAQRKYIQERRVEVGLSPELSETPPASAPAERVPVAGRVRVEVWFRTNEAEPVRTEFIVENGTPTPVFDASGGLWADVRATLFGDGWATMEYRFYEDRNGKRQMLRGMSTAGTQADAKPLQYGLVKGGIGTIVGGSKAYSVRMDAHVSAAP